MQWWTVLWQWFFSVSWVFPSTPKPMWLYPRWQLAFSSNFRPWLLHTKISLDSLNHFTVLWTVDGERSKFFAILCWETLYFTWLTILSQSLAQSGEPRPILACRLSLWWMLLLYSISITSCWLLQIVKRSRTVLLVTLSVLFCLCPNFFWVCCRHHILLFFIFTKYN